MDMTHVGELMRAPPYWPLDNAKDDILLLALMPGERSLRIRQLRVQYLEGSSLVIS
jgi:hypothetical protein